jgi:hypothetical protein
MSPQYQILSELLGALRTSAFCDGRHNGVECLIYRLKLLLLNGEKFAPQELNTHCPSTVLRELQRVLMIADSAESARTALLWVEGELQRLIHQLEAKCLEIEAQSAQEVLAPPVLGTLSQKAAQRQSV